MINQIQTLLENIGKFFTNIGKIIEMIWNGMMTIPKLLEQITTSQMNVFNFIFPPIVVGLLTTILVVVALYKIFGRT